MGTSAETFIGKWISTEKPNTTKNFTGVIFLMSSTITREYQRADMSPSDLVPGLS